MEINTKKCIIALKLRFFFSLGSRSHCRCGALADQLGSPLPPPQNTLPSIPETATPSNVKVNQRGQEGPWDYKQDTVLVPTDAFGDIEFDGFGENERKVYGCLIILKFTINQN